LDATNGCFESEEEGIYSEVKIYEFMEKCIMPLAEHNKILFVTNYSSANELNIAFDNALVRYKKTNIDRDVQVEVLCICRE